MTHKRLVLGFGATALFLSASTFALAQATPPPTPAETGAITVYATRQATNIQKTPLQVTALGAQKLKDSNANQLRDITYLAPSVRYTSDSGAEYTSITMRGIGAAASGGSGPGVQVYEDEVPLAGAALNSAPYDVQDVEVLQGPQGTTFGRNTLAGAVLITPVLPSFQQNGYIKGSYGSYNYEEVEGGVNLTLKPDVLAVRLAGEFERRDGDIQALSPTGGPSTVLGAQNNLNNTDFRATVLFTPTATLKNLLTFDYNSEFTTGQPAMVDNPLARLSNAVAATGSQANAAAFLGYASYANALADAQALAACHHLCLDYGNLTQPSLAFYNRSYRLFNTTTWDVTPNVTLKNIVGWQQVQNHLGEDSTASLFGTTPAATGAFLAASWTNVRQLSEEFQVAANAFDNRVHAVAGVFYVNQNQFGTDGALLNNALALGSGGKNSSEAVYTNIIVGITDKLKFRGGFRYTWDQVTSCTAPTVVDLGFGPFPAPGTPPGTAEACFASVAAHTGATISSKSSSAPTWSLGLDFQATPDTFLYIVSRRGYRAPALNLSITDPCEGGAPSIYAPGSTHALGDAPDPGRATFCANDSGVAATYNRNAHTNTSLTGDASGQSINIQSLANEGAETITDVEIGVRTSWQIADWRFRANVDYYHYWDNNVSLLTLLGIGTPGTYDLLCGYYPVNPPISTTAQGAQCHTGGTAFGGVTTTAGGTTADGVQADFQVMPTRDLSLDFNVSWINQKAVPAALPASFFQGMTTTEIANLHAGNTLGQLVSPTAPWAFTLAARYVLPWHPLDGDLVVNYNYYWTAGWFDQNLPAPGYDLHNLRIDWNNINHTNVSAGIWVRNLLDRDYIISIVNLNGGVDNHGDPRMIGVDLSYKFH